jgi:putative Holliday junction resolvase
MRSLALDIGERRIGVAVSDPLGISAAPLEVLVDKSPDDLRTYIEEKVRQGVELVVVGLPLTCRGKEGAQARHAQEYARRIEVVEGARVVLWDERFSTVEAEKRLREAGRSIRGRKVDAEAAAVILQAYLEYRRRSDEGKEQGSG